jgi:hypothetical protein
MMYVLYDIVRYRIVRCRLFTPHYNSTSYSYTITRTQRHKERDACIEGCAVEVSHISHQKHCKRNAKRDNIMADEIAMEEGAMPSRSSNPSKSRKSKMKMIKANTPMEIFAGCVAAVSIGTSVTAMVFNGGTALVYVAGGLSSVIGPYAYYQQTKLTDIIALKETHEAVKREVDRLQAENVRLNETVGELSDTVDKLEDVEQALDVITQTQGQSVAAFAEQVKENRDILGQMQKNLRANVLQNLLQVVIRSDQDDSMQIEMDEVDDLIARIKKINGVEVSEERFKRAIRSSGGSLSSVMDIIKNLMAEDTSEEEQIFTVKNE